MVENLNASCMRQAHQTVLVSPAYKYMQSMMDKLCHIEVKMGECTLEKLALTLPCLLGRVATRKGVTTSSCSHVIILSSCSHCVHTVQVIEYCDLGNLSTALKNQVWGVAEGD